MTDKRSAHANSLRHQIKTAVEDLPPGGSADRSRSIEMTEQKLEPFAFI
jgi:hypothetical protein